MSTDRFTPFSHLPVEIRLLIWNLALVPDTPDRALFHYKSGCWIARELTKDDPDYNAEHEDWNFYVDFKHELLEPVVYSLPLFQVCREARGVAMAYMASERVQLWDADAHLVARRFDPARDVLFTPTSEELTTVIKDSMERLFETDLVDQMVSCSHPSISTVALLPEALTWLSGSMWELWYGFGGVESLLVVANASDYMLRPGGHWAVVSAHDTTYRWDMEARRMVWTGERDGPLADMFSAVEEFGEGLGQQVVECHLERFEIRVVTMVLLL